MSQYSEDDLLPLSALQHLLFCERQCALIHIEQLWSENLFTAQGRIMHERVDGGGHESRGKVRLAFGLALRSFRLGLVGKADVVEFHQDKAGGWQPFPVEHKRGRPKQEDWDKVQLCAQAICLEEMLNCAIPAGAIFYGKTRRRQEVAFDEPLRREVVETAVRLHQLIAAGITPPPLRDARCDSCSLFDLCLPDGVAVGHSAVAYLARELARP
ncbi:MAG: CRISPR-associated protein Cas4 [Desulfobulbaceae bacterium]|nr:CRISPR-associated protein Cas4 [Desulfobulbaceae bacterium]